MQNIKEEFKNKQPITTGRFDDKLMNILLKVIRFSVRILAVIMTFVIL